MTWGKPPKGKGGKGRGGGGGNGHRKGHKHDWREVRRSAITKGPFKGRTLVMYVCDADGCPNPDKMAIE